MVCTLGVTVTAAVVAPVLHKYEVPPDAVSVVEEPEQTILVPVMAGVGLLETVTVALADLVQPLAPVTVTV